MMTSTNRRNAWIALVLGLTFGSLIALGQCLEDDTGAPPPLPSDGAQFRQWLCTEYDALIDVGC